MEIRLDGGVYGVELRDQDAQAHCIGRAKENKTTRGNT